MPSKPRLVDYNLIDFPKKQITNIQRKIVKQDNTKFYVNLVMVVILCIGGYILYYRMQNRINMIDENKANLLFINEYINQSLDNSKQLEELYNETNPV
tara:strand:+ start:340 stop:633 length:294 start_codon:yes stop_codon:yes gene_type:complete